MQSKTSFVASLFVFAFCMLLAGAMSGYERFDIWRHGEVASMQLADPDREYPQYDDGMGTRPVDVRYVGNGGAVVVPNKFVAASVAQRLIDGDSLTVTYMTNNLHRIYYPNDPLPNPWPWLVVGCLALATALYALKLRKREANS